MYTKGAKESKKFNPFGRMRYLDNIYKSSELFPIFSNRLLPKSRPEYKQFINWLSLEENEADSFNILSITGGLRKTDNLEIFPCPKKDEDGKYKVTFFSRGISHLPKDTRERVNQLKPGDRLFIMRDIQNEFDLRALVMRSKDPISFVGYCPRYFNDDFNFLLDKCDGNDVEVRVKKINQDAPYQMKLLCTLVACWPENFSPCRDKLYEPLPDISGDEKFSCHTLN